MFIYMSYLYKQNHTPPQQYTNPHRKKNSSIQLIEPEIKYIHKYQQKNKCDQFKYICHDDSLRLCYTCICRAIIHINYNYEGIIEARNLNIMSMAQTSYTISYTPYTPYAEVSKRVVFTNICSFCMPNHIHKIWYNMSHTLGKGR